MWLSYEGLDTGGLAHRFAVAHPFPHVVLDDFLCGDLASLVDAFPDETWEGWTTQFRDRYQANKRACDDFEAIPEPLRSLILELQSPGFLEFMEQVTGIDQLIPDPYLTGGGLHLSGPAGVLEPHSDFHLYPRLNLYRQINVLLYLNPVWDESWGGSLELFADAQASQCTRRVVPTLGRCVIFRTDDRSVHGFPEAIADGHWRRSVALYYYTAAARPDYVGDKYTYWRRHGEQHGLNKVRLHAHRALVTTQRLVAAAAKAMRPPEPKPAEAPPIRARRPAVLDLREDQSGALVR